jgi:hypothetical protein
MMGILLRMRARSLVAVLGLVMLGGCRFKSWESFETATTPSVAGEWQGDEYASGGIANASGGTQPKTHYGLGAKTQGGKLEGKYDQPMMGAGLRPGEYNGSALPGTSRSNAPIMQGEPGTVNSPTVAGGRP